MCKSCRPKLAGVKAARRSKPPDEPVKKPRPTKDTKKWCRGKVGTHHEPTWKRDRWGSFMTCDQCGRDMNKRCRPDWKPDQWEWDRRRHKGVQPPCICMMHSRFKS